MARLYLIKDDENLFSGLIKNVDEVMPGIWAFYVESMIYSHWVTCPIIFESESMHALMEDMLSSGEWAPATAILNQIEHCAGTKVPRTTNFVVPVGYRLRFLIYWAYANGFSVASSDILPEGHDSEDYFLADFDGAINDGEDDENNLSEYYQFSLEDYDPELFAGHDFLFASIGRDGVTLLLSVPPDGFKPPSDFLSFTQLLIWLSIINAVSVSKGVRLGLSPGSRPEVFGMSSN